MGVGEQGISLSKKGCLANLWPNSVAFRFTVAALCITVATFCSTHLDFDQVKF